MEFLEPGEMVFLSDLHIKNPQDPVYATLNKFLESELKKDSSLAAIFLLGDIFDLLVGPFEFWFEEYPHFFKNLKEHLNKGTRIVWIEGNHDFFIESLLSEFPRGLTVADPFFIFDTGVCGIRQRIHLSHGDLVNTRDKPYLRWRAITRNLILRSFLSLVPQALAKKFLKPWAEKVSRRSRESYASTPEQETFLRTLYRNCARNLWQKGFYGVFMGHVHLRDEYVDRQNGHFYFNLGSRYDSKSSDTLRYVRWNPEHEPFPNTKLYSTIER
jgi:UDP-2,3-diacylglucosamine hydrolase